MHPTYMRGKELFRWTNICALKNISLISNHSSLQIMTKWKHEETKGAGEPKESECNVLNYLGVINKIKQ